MAMTNHAHHHDAPIPAHAPNGLIGPGGVYGPVGAYKAVCLCGYASRPKLFADAARAALAGHIAKAVDGTHVIDCTS